MEPVLAVAKSETLADFGAGPTANVARWASEIELALKAQQKWEKRGEKIIGLYTLDADDSVDAKRRRFTLLWSNIETLSPAVYARTPTAVVSRRWKDADPVGRVASEVLERSLNFSLEAVDFADVMLGARLEYLLLGRGQTWIRYVPHIQQVQPPAPPAANADAGQVAPAGQAYEVVSWEEAVPDHVSWNDFLTNPARKWAEVRWVGRRVFMTRDELKARFPQCGAEVPLDHSRDADRKDGEADEQFAKATVWEIWDKATRQAIWINTGYTARPLDQRPDPLGLKDFFPCPRPLLGTCGPNSIIPTPDYVQYESQAKDINTLTYRIGLLMDALRLRGFYAAGNDAAKGLADLFSDETGTLIPVDAWAAFAEKGGVKGLIEWVPIDLVASTLKSCIEVRKQLIDDVYQLTGISDIMRGDTDANETAAAQKLKSNWGSSRVRDKQNELTRFARDILSLMGEVIATKFSPQTLAAMSNVQLFESAAAKQQAIQAFQQQMQQWQAAAQHAQATRQQPPPQPQPPPEAVKMATKPTWEDVLGLLRNNPLRSFRLDVESDSTIEQDDEAQKKARIQFTQTVAQYVEKSIPAIQLMPQLAPIIAEGLKYLVRGFRVGREMEETIDRALDQLQAAGGQAQGQQPPKGPNPQVEQAKAQAAETKAQASMTDAQTRQFEAQTHRYEAQAGVATDQAAIQAENARTAADRQADMHMHGQGLQADLQHAVMQSQARQLVRDINAPWGSQG